MRVAASALAVSEPEGLREKLASRFRSAAKREELSSLLPAEMLSDAFLGHILAGLLAWYGNQQASMQSVLDAVTLLFWNGARERGE